MPTKFVQYDKWPTTVYLGADVTVFDGDKVGVWNGACYARQAAWTNNDMNALVGQNGVPVPVSGAGIYPLGQMSAAYRARLSAGNPRTEAGITNSAVAFGGTPTTGELGYANASIVTTGWTRFNIANGGSCTWPATRPLLIEGADVERNDPMFRSLTYLVGGVTRVSGAWRARFATTAAEIAVRALGSGNVYNLNVDGRRASVGCTNAAGGGLQYFSLNLRGLSSGWHEVEFLLQQDQALAEILVPSTSLVLTPGRKPVIAWFNDSLGNSVASGSSVVQFDCFPHVVGDYLGAESRVFAGGGTGYETASTSETFQSRIALAAARLTAAGVSPAVVVFAGGINDGAGTAGLQAAVQATIAAAQAQWPTARIVVVGSWASNNSGSQSNQVTCEGKISAAATAAGVSFVPVMTDPSGAWISGTGNVSSPTGVGTADVLFNSADGTHWNAAGHGLLGAQLAHGIAKLIGL